MPKIKMSSNDRDKRTPSKRIVDAFFEAEQDLIIKEFLAFLETDTQRILEAMRDFVACSQKANADLLNSKLIHNPEDIEALKKDCTYELEPMIKRFLLNLQVLRCEVLNVYTNSVLETASNNKHSREKQ